MKSPISTVLTCRRSRQDRGFTLFEIMVVLMIIGLVVVVGFPMMRRAVVRARLLSEANVLKQTVAVARSASLKQGQSVVVRFLEDNAVQEGGEFLAWVDLDGNGAPGGPGETIVGKWPVKKKVLLKPDAANVLMPLAGNARGVRFLPNGTAVTNASGRVGIGQGAVVVSDRYQNDIRLLIMAGTGTVIQEMWDPHNGKWSKDLRHWRY